MDEYPAEHLDCQCPDQLNPSHLRAAGLILSPEEVEELIASAKNLMHRAMLMTLYATGLRRSELCQLSAAGTEGVIDVICGTSLDCDRDYHMPP